MPIRTKSTTLPHQTTVVDLVEYESRSATVALALEPLTFCRPDPRGERGERRHAQRRPQTQHQLRRGICDRYCITDHEAAADDEASQLRKQIHYQQQRWQKLPTEFEYTNHDNWNRTKRSDDTLGSGRRPTQIVNASLIGSSQKH